MHVHVFVPSYVILFFPTCNVVPLICVLGASEYYYVVLGLPTYFLSTIPHYELLWIFFVMVAVDMQPLGFPINLCIVIVTSSVRRCVSNR